jgi:hypothetical protein
MAAARSPDKTVVSAQRGSVSVFDATYLGRVFRASAMGPLPHGPSVALESGHAFHLRRAVSLHHSIDGDLRGGRQLHDRDALLAGGAPRGRPLAPATNTPAPIRHRFDEE